MSYFKCVCAIVVWVVMLPEAAMAAAVPGTKVSIEAPAGFSPAIQFAGFQRREDSASIVVSEVPAPIGTMRAGMTEQALATRGVTLRRSDAVQADGRDAVLLFLEQTERGVDFEKWMLLFGDESTSVIVLATYPKAAAEALRDALKLSVLSTTWDPDRQVGVFEGLPFRVSESKSLKISSRISNTLVLTENGQKQMIDSSDPVLVVGTSHSEVELDDLEAFAQHRLAQTPEIKDVINRVGESISVNGVTAYELSADARDATTAGAVKVYQLVVPDGDNYFIAQGIVGARRAERFFPQFRDVARSLTKE